MLLNEQTINRFYTAFQQLDYRTMQSCYHPDAVFSDPVFGLLDVHETKAMWEMLCTRATNFSLRYEQIRLLDDEYSTCNWTCSYTFLPTGRTVVNKSRAHMQFRNGLIVGHTDAFDIYRWSRQAFGVRGWLFGWTNFMHRRIQVQARVQLELFMTSG